MWIVKRNMMFSVTMIPGPEGCLKTGSNLITGKQALRPKDISGRLKAVNASVTSGLHSLAEMVP